MKQKIVIKMSIYDNKSRSKALKIAVCMAGVESVAVTGEEKDQVVVVGDRIDSVELTRRLRKKMGHAELLSVGKANKNLCFAAAAAAATETAEPTVVGTVAPPYLGYPSHYYYEVGEPTWSSPCTML